MTLVEKIGLIILGLLIIISGTFLIIGFRYDIKDFFLTVWYGKEKYRDIKIVKYTKPMFGGWNASEVDEFEKAIKRLKESGFKFKGEIKKIAKETLRSVQFYGFAKDVSI